jgi:hypothetical protein
MDRKLGGKVQITFVNGLHNHPCDVPQAAVSQRLSGRNIESLLPLVAVPSAPHLVGGKKITLSTARKILKAHLGNGINIDGKSLSNLIAVVSKYINSDKFEGIPAGVMLLVTKMVTIVMKMMLWIFPGMFLMKMGAVEMVLKGL